MKLIIFFVFVVILVVRGVFISDIMSRNPTYDNRTTLPTYVISLLYSRSLLHCASYCTRNDECKSTMYNMNTHSCQLMSVHMDELSVTGPQSYLGWLYYERKCEISDEPMSTSSTADVMTTGVSTGTSKSTFEGTMPTTTTVNVETTVVSTETTQTTFDCSIWQYRFGHWYLLDTNYRTFNNSRTFCASLSPTAYVIEVQSRAENDWLLELTSTNCGMAYEYWLNGYDTDNSGTFTWIDSQTQTTYTNWYTGQPDDYSGIGSEKCIVSSTGHGGVWNDIPCTGPRPVVCERNI